jgi:hypothetical protein
VEVVHGYAVPLVVANRGCGGLQSEAVPLMASTELSCSAGLQGEAIPLVAAMWPGLWSDKAVPLVGSQSRERRPAEIGQKLCQIITKSSPKLVPCKSKNYHKQTKKHLIIKIHNTENTDKKFSIYYSMV